MDCRIESIYIKANIFTEQSTDRSGFIKSLNSTFFIRVNLFINAPLKEAFHLKSFKLTRN